MTRFQGDTKNIRRIATKSQQEKFTDDPSGPAPICSIPSQTGLLQPRYSADFPANLCYFRAGTQKRLPILFNPANRHAPARSITGTAPRRSRSERLVPPPANQRKVCWRSNGRWRGSKKRQSHQGERTVHRSLVERGVARSGRLGNE